MYVCLKCKAKMPIGTVSIMVRGMRNEENLEQIKTAAKEVAAIHEALIKTEKSVLQAILTETVDIDKEDIAAVTSAIYFHKTTSVQDLVKVLGDSYIANGGPMRKMGHRKRCLIAEYLS